MDWADVTRATSYDVYFGASNPPPSLGNTGSSNWSLPKLNYFTKYYWRIVAKNTGGSTSGPIWSFTTARLGDLNCDGAFDGADIWALFTGLTDWQQYLRDYPGCDLLNGDMNGDGYVDGGDITPFFDLLGGGR